MSKIIEQSAAGIAVLGAISQETIVTYSAAATAVLFVCGKAYADFREKRSKADQAEARDWGDMLMAARGELGDAKSELKAVRAEIAQLKAQNGGQADQIKDLEGKVKILADSQRDVVKSTNKQKARVENVTERVGAVEQALGSSSNLELPATEPSTSIDLPNIE